MSESKSEKTPIYKKKWFWVVAILAIMVVGSAISSAEKDPKKVGGGESGTTGSSENQTFKMGDVVAIDGVEVTAKSIQRNWVAEYSKPDAGKEYVKVTVQIENKSDEKKSYNALDWKMEDGEGAMEGNEWVSLDDYLSSGDLAKGGKKTGSMIFEVPKDDTKLKLHYVPNFFSNREAVIELY